MKKQKKHISYHARWGHERYRTLKGHPKRTARQQRAYDRGAPKPKQKEVAE